MPSQVAQTRARAAPVVEPLAEPVAPFALGPGLQKRVGHRMGGRSVLGSRCEGSLGERPGLHVLAGLGGDERLLTKEEPVVAPISGVLEGERAVSITTVRRRQHDVVEDVHVPDDEPVPGIGA